MHTSLTWKEKSLLQLYSEKNFSHGTGEQEILKDTMRDACSTGARVVQESASEGHLPLSMAVKGETKVYGMCHPKTPPVLTLLHSSCFITSLQKG